MCAAQQCQHLIKVKTCYVIYGRKIDKWAADLQTETAQRSLKRTRQHFFGKAQQCGSSQSQQVQATESAIKCYFIVVLYIILILLCLCLPSTKNHS